MPESRHSPVHPEVRYEKSDAWIGAIVVFGVLLALMVIAAQVGAVWLFDGLKEREKQKNQQFPSEFAGTRPHFPADLSKIPAPRLQENETLDVRKLHEHEEALLYEYGWVDRDKKIVRIPIEQAMSMLADPKIAAAHGVRARPQPEAKK